MKQATLYGVGVGPGDPELITRKAERVIRAAAVLAVPDKGRGRQTALDIIGTLAEGKIRLDCSTPMVRDQAVLDAAYDAAADAICAQLDQGRDVAFITLGDPTVYSTYLYVHRRVTARGYRAEIIPGVPSFCAAAARLGQPLCEKSQRLLIVPASHGDMEDCLGVDANLVFMKAGREIGALKDTLAAHGLLERASLVANCGMEGELVCPRFAELEEGSGYFSVVLVKKGEEA
ncbi:precorrin-2 C(20)-methyltransferase [Flavonifractor hominis]|uniref:Precorrin-2 C(20)-methyltransferase n=1 Tax=Flavonifractor hominis TaxID=3133178 RepID=A0ABV1EQ96_9FIRM